MENIGRSDVVLLSPDANGGTDPATTRFGYVLQ